MVAEDRGTEEGVRKKKNPWTTEECAVCSITQYGFHIWSNGAQGNDISKEVAANKCQKIIFPVPFLMFCVGKAQWLEGFCPSVCSLN